MKIIPLPEKKAPDAFVPVTILTFSDLLWSMMFVFRCFSIFFCTIERQILFQILCQLVNAAHLITDGNALRAFGFALFATYAVAGLTKFRYTAIVTVKKFAPCFFII